MSLLELDLQCRVTAELAAGISPAMLSCGRLEHAKQSSYNPLNASVTLLTSRHACACTWAHGRKEKQEGTAWVLAGG